MGRRSAIAIALAVGFWIGSALAGGAHPEQTSAPALTPEEAKQHIGEHAVVCGRVASARFAATSRGRPTFLNLGKPYPYQVFTVVIWGEDRDKFGEPEQTYRGETICVTGRITSYRGQPQIVATQPSQIRLKREGTR
ncbi:MAG TPA: hypothetical protein VNI83_12075 [Vicinamibacterales bacterium]|nr:hypothetical protein [Vicinamibacterales bacterium]